MNGVELITLERQRQIEKEGWTLEHDQEHAYGGLAVTAAALAVVGTDAVVCDPLGRGTPRMRAEIEADINGDAWGLQSKHAADVVRRLVIAGALIAAEIDRLQIHRGTNAP